MRPGSGSWRTRACRRPREVQAQDRRASRVLDGTRYFVYPWPARAPRACFHRGDVLMPPTDTRTLEVPAIDIGSFREGSPDDRREVARQIANAFETIGFATVTGHGIEPSSIDKMFDTARGF